jgi:hypothetical protein
MADMLRRWIALTFILGACGGGGDGGEGDSCGPGMACQGDLVCDPVSHTCQRRGGSSDAGVDAAEAVDTTLGITPPASTMADSASFSFASNAAGATFECRVDGGAYTPCTSPISYQGLDEGSHTFEVRATVGTVTDPTPATYTWVIDRTAPTPVVASPRDGASVCSTVVVSLATALPETGVTYKCALDGGAPASCAPPTVTYSGLAGGAHAVHVVATDQAGNVSTPLTVSFTVDVAPPTIDARSFAVTPGATNTGTATFTVNAADATGLMAAQAGLVYGPSPFPDPTDTSMCACTVATATQIGCSCNQLAAGRNFLAVRAVDVCGQGSTYAATNANVTFGPYDGHAVVIGHDYTGPQTPPQILQNAVTLAPFRHHTLFDRPLRILGFTAGTPDTTGAKAALGALIQAPNAYAEFTDYTRLDTALPGRDVLLIYDQNRAPGDPFFTTVATAWNATLHAFLDAGGVVVLMDGTYVTANGTTPTGTHEIFSNATAPIIVGLQATTFADVTVMNPFRAGYPDDGAHPYWLTRGASRPLLAYGPFIEGTVGFTNFFTFLQQPTVSNTGAAFPYVQAFDACSDGCVEEYPIVVDKIFPDHRIDVAVNLTPQGRTGSTGTGTFRLATAGVPRSGFNCFIQQYPDYPADATVPTTPCTITSSPADTEAGAFSFDAGATGYTGNWVAVITRLDGDDEPSSTGMATWQVDGDTYAFMFTVGTFPYANARSTYWVGNSEWFSNVTCRLYYNPSAAPDPANCTGSCVLRATLTNAACGAVAVPGQNAWQQPATGNPTINWDIFMTGSGFYMGQIFVTDMFGNQYTSNTGSWQVSL